jgi:hypothetical protein
MSQPSAPVVSSKSAQAPPTDRARDISEDIDRTLGRRTAPEGTLRARAEDEVKHAGDRVWHGMKKRPSLGMIVIGGLAVLAADAIGVGEVALGVALGYAAYRVLRRGKGEDEGKPEETEAKAKR